MYSDKLAKRKAWILWIVLLVLLVGGCLLVFSGRERELGEGSAVAIRAAVQRRISSILKTTTASR